MNHQVAVSCFKLSKRRAIQPYLPIRPRSTATAPEAMPWSNTSYGVAVALRLVNKSRNPDNDLDLYAGLEGHHHAGNNFPKFKFEFKA